MQQSQANRREGPEYLLWIAQRRDTMARVSATDAGRILQTHCTPTFLKQTVTYYQLASLPNRLSALLDVN